VRVDLRGVTWKPASLTEEDQEHGEAEPTGPALGFHQSLLVWCKVPVILAARRVIPQMHSDRTSRCEPGYRSGSIV